MTRFEHKGKCGKLLGACVYVYTRKVLGKDALDGFATSISFGDIEVVKKVETFIEDMSRTTSQVSYFQVFDI